MTLKTCLIALTAMLLAGCSEMIASTAPDGADAAADRTYQLLAKGEIDTLMTDGGPEMQTAEAQEGIAQMIAMIPKEAPIGSRILGWNTHVQVGKETTAVIRRQYDYASIVVITEATLTRKNKSERWVTRGFNLKVDPKAAKDKPTGKGEKT